MKLNLKKHKTLLLIFTLLMSLFIAGCSEDVVAPTQPEVIAPVVEEVEDTTIELSMLAVGDNLIHGPIYRQAAENAIIVGEPYNFYPAYKNIIPYLEGKDLKFINQETPLGGTELTLSSYPMFNSPQELGVFLVEIGFNMISHANNHVIDKGSSGFFNTIEFWETQEVNDVIMAGIAADEASDEIQILEVEGVKVALLAYTYGTNGLSLPSSSTGIVKLISDDLILTEVAQAQELADIIVVSMHWGSEYQSAQNAEQERLAQMMADAGVDIIIGTHPHVLQNVDILTGEQGNQTAVFYSLGNFISAQATTATMIGGMAEIQMNYDTETGDLDFSKVALIPIVNHYTAGYEDITIYPLVDYTEELASAHGIRSSYSYFSLDYIYEEVESRVDAKYIDVK